MSRPRDRPARSRAMSDCRVSTCAGRARRATFEQVGVAVVQDPVLPAGQAWREPAPHRSRCRRRGRGSRGGPWAGAGPGRGARRGVGGLAQGEPVLADAGHRGTSAARVDRGRGRRPPGSSSRRARAARRSRSRSAGRSATRAARGQARSPATSSPPSPSASLTPPTSLAITGHAVRERLGDHHAVRLGPRRQHQQVGVRIAGRRHTRPREAHPPSISGSLADERGIAIEAADACAPPGQVGQRRQRSEQQVVALLRRHRRDAEQSLARRRSLAISARSTPGIATCTRSAASPCASSSRAGSTRWS